MRRVTRRLVPLVLALALVADAGRALAAGRDPASAEALFRDGRAAFDRGDYAAAKARFAESQRLDPAPGTLLNLALAEEKLGELARAWQHVREALAELPADDRRPLAEKLLADLERRVPRLAVALAEGVPPGTRVRRDDVELQAGSMGVALPVDPGTHVVVVTAEGREEMRYVTTAHEGETERLVVGPGPRAVAGDEPRAPASGTRWLGWGLVAGGGAALAIGGVGGLLAMSKKSEVDRHCDAERVCDDQAFSAADRGKTYATIGTVGFVAGAALAGAGVVVLLTSKPGGPSATARVAPGSAVATLGVTFLPGAPRPRVSRSSRGESATRARARRARRRA